LSTGDVMVNALEKHSHNNALGKNKKKKEKKVVVN
jgi:hypothetical protein